MPIRVVVIMKRKIQILDHELHLRSISDSFVRSHLYQGSRALIDVRRRIGRFDELTHFFNLIHGLFHQPALTFGLCTHSFTPWARRLNINFGLNAYIDTPNQRVEQIDLLRNLTLFATLDRNDQEDFIPISLVRFNTLNRNFMFGINHRWTPSLISTFVFGTKPETRFSSRLEYRHAHTNCEIIGQYSDSRVSSLQLNYLSCLRYRDTYCIDGGFDYRVKYHGRVRD